MQYCYVIKIARHKGALQPQLKNVFRQAPARGRQGNKSYIIHFGEGKTWACVGGETGPVKLSNQKRLIGRRTGTKLPWDEIIQSQLMSRKLIELAWLNLKLCSAFSCAPLFFVLASLFADVCSCLRDEGGVAVQLPCIILNCGLGNYGMGPAWLKCS